MLLVRIVHFLIGGALAGGGGFLAWTERARFHSIFPPDPAASPWMLIAGLGALTAGLVFLASAAAPRPKRSAKLAAQAERRREMLAAADSFYAERARAADRDWRSGDLPAAPAADQAPEKAPVAESWSPTPPAPARSAPPSPAPAPNPEPMAATRMAEPLPELFLTTPARPAALKPVATSVPPAQTDSPFPSMATLTPIPRAMEPPPLTATLAPQPARPAAAGGNADPFAEIRSAITDGRLVDADRLLSIHREKAQGAALAELTGLAGDHAAAAGRTSNAKWLWRLALKRFGEINAMDSPAARAVSESLRLADN